MICTSGVGLALSIKNLTLVISSSSLEWCATSFGPCSRRIRGFFWNLRSTLKLKVQMTRVKRTKECFLRRQGMICWLTGIASNCRKKSWRSKTQGFWRLLGLLKRWEFTKIRRKERLRLPCMVTRNKTIWKKAIFRRNKIGRAEHCCSSKTNKKEKITGLTVLIVVTLTTKRSHKSMFSGLISWKRKQ